MRARGNSALGCLTAYIDFDQNFQLLPELLCGGIQLLRQTQRIDRIHRSEQFNRFRRFVGLQMANQMPFDLWSLEEQFRAYFAAHGDSYEEKGGLSLEEVWASQQLHDAKPMLLVVASPYADQGFGRVEPLRVRDSDVLVWLVAAICMRIQLTEPYFNVLVTNGSSGHTIRIANLIGLKFEHPRGTCVTKDWFSFRDPWPARSLLAPERDYGVNVVEDIGGPPLWLISPEDLQRIIVGFIISIDMLAGLLTIFREADRLKALRDSAKPIWMDDPTNPDTPFSRMLSQYQGLTPLSIERMIGVAKFLVKINDTDGAQVLFERAYNIAPARSAFSAKWAFKSVRRPDLADLWADRLRQQTP